MAQCIFLHESSGNCKYVERCEREKCMYKHNVDVIGEDDDEENDILEDDGEREKTFFNPSQSESKTESIDVKNDDDDNKENDDDTHENDNLENKNDDVNNNVEEMMKCDFCVFETKDLRRFRKHQVEIHSVKGKYVCCSYREEFYSIKWFNSHKYKGCNPSTVARWKPWTQFRKTTNLNNGAKKSLIFISDWTHLGP